MFPKVWLVPARWILRSDARPREGGVGGFLTNVLAMNLQSRKTCGLAPHPTPRSRTCSTWQTLSPMKAMGSTGPNRKTPEGSERVPNSSGGSECFGGSCRVLQGSGGSWVSPGRSWGACESFQWFMQHEGEPYACAFVPTHGLMRLRLHTSCEASAAGCDRRAAPSLSDTVRLRNQRGGKEHW